MYHITYFYPRSPCGERPAGVLYCHLIPSISIHALLAESDGFFPTLEGHRKLFLSTLSLRRATTHPVTVFVCEIISIHALLAESDNSRANHIERNKDFYPRSPCGERLLAAHWVLSTLIFLSTLSLRRATFKMPVPA